MLKAAQFFWSTAAASVYGFDVGDRLMHDVSEKLCPLREIIGGSSAFPATASSFWSRALPAGPS